VRRGESRGVFRPEESGLRRVFSQIASELITGVSLEGCISPRAGYCSPAAESKSRRSPTRLDVNDYPGLSSARKDEKMGEVLLIADCSAELFEVDRLPRFPSTAKRFF